MSIFDLLIAGVVLLGLWRGFHQGAIKTALSLVAWFLALVLATRLANQFSPLFVNLVDNPVLQMALGFLLVFLAVISVLQFIAFVLAKLLKVLKLGFLDRMAGAILGAGVGVLKVLVVLSVTAPLLIHLPTWQNSPLAQSLLPFAPLAKALLFKTLLLEITGDWQEINQSTP